MSAALFREPGGGWIELLEPTGSVVVWSPRDVEPALLEVDRRLALGEWSAGFVAFEAAPAFDPAMKISTATGSAPGPLCWWGFFRAARRLEARPVLGDVGPWRLAAWEAGLDTAAYLQRVEEIQRRIASGDLYQANLTYPLKAKGTSARTLPLGGLAERLASRQSGAHAGLLATGPLADGSSLEVACGSPELFLSLEGDRLISRPMKGTAARLGEADEAIASRLASSEKERAENLMIVDMVRNDLGRVAVPGSVEVGRLFEIEEYPTVFQMTSTVSARTGAPLSEILAATFPPASVTGAPKISSMKTIAELEVGPRGVYCGAVGWAGPGRRASLAVAIRTAFRRAPGEPVVYGVGSGIVADSSPQAEAEECRAKGAVVAGVRPRRLLETLLLDGRGRYRLLDLHLDRLGRSARQLGHLWDPEQAAERLEELRGEVQGPRIARLLLSASGALALDTRAYVRRDRGVAARARLAVDDRPVDSLDPLLRHKTDDRRRYDEALVRARKRVADCEDVLLFNERGELTESCVANVAVLVDGQWLTPGLECGLLAGTLRRRLLERGRLTEARIPIGEALRASRLVLLSSVRGITDATVVGTPVEGAVEVELRSRPAGRMEPQP